MSTAISIVNPEVSTATSTSSNNSVPNWSPKTYGTSGGNAASYEGGTSEAANVEQFPLRKGNLADDVTKREAVEKSLWWWNLSCAIAHLVQAIAALVIGQNKNSNVGKFKIPLTTSFLSWDDVRGYPIQEHLVRQLVPFASLTSGFSWMSAAAHIIVLLCWSRYLQDLRKGINHFRWYEYSVSSSLMIVLIAMLFGMYDVVSLILLASVNACMNLFGLLMELHNQTTRTTDWTSFWYGCFAGAVPWAMIFTYVGGSSVGNEIPAFVWAILFVYLFAFNTFPINMILQYLQVGRWADQYHGWRMGGYYYGEKLYQIQSLVSKSLLLWLVLGGVNQPNEYTQSS